VPNLYGRVFDGVELGPEDVVISADEKSQLQALRRRHPGTGPRAGRPRRAYIAAYDVHVGRLFGSVADKTGIAPFMALADQVMSIEPYRSARRDI
jgi:hypothetical protein